jgi:hypothetical protein
VTGSYSVRWRVTVIKRRTSICLEGWYYLVVMAFVCAGGALREINLLMVLFGLMLGAFLLSWRLVRRSTRGLEFKRRAPHVVRAGELFTVDVEVRNSNRRGDAWALVIDDLVQQTAPRTTAVPLPVRLYIQQAPAGASRQHSYQARLMQRGLCRFGPLRCESRFPLGLVRRTLIDDQPAEITVYPRLGQLSAAWTRQRQEATSGSQQVQRPVGLREGDYHALRDWRPGDSRRWIHWRTTARRGELMVRQFEQHRNQDLLLIVELCCPASSAAPQPGASAPPIPAAELVESVVSFVATVLADRCAGGGGMITLGLAAQHAATLDILRGPASQALFRDAMRELAVVEARPAGAAGDPLPDLLDQVLQHARGGAEVVLVSTRPIDLTDTQRFASIWSDKHKQAWIGRILAITAEEDGLRQWFEECGDEY